MTDLIRHISLTSCTPFEQQVIVSPGFFQTWKKHLKRLYFSPYIHNKKENRTISLLNIEVCEFPVWCVLFVCLFVFLLLVGIKAIMTRACVTRGY